MICNITLTTWRNVDYFAGGFPFLASVSEYTSLAMRKEKKASRCIAQPQISSSKRKNGINVFLELQGINLM